MKQRTEHLGSIDQKGANHLEKIINGRRKGMFGREGGRDVDAEDKGMQREGAES